MIYTYFIQNPDLYHIKSPCFIIKSPFFSTAFGTAVSSACGGFVSPRHRRGQIRHADTLLLAEAVRTVFGLPVVLRIPREVLELSVKYGDGSKPWYLVNPKIAGIYGCE